MVVLQVTRVGRSHGQMQVRMRVQRGRRLSDGFYAAFPPAMGQNGPSARDPGDWVQGKVRGEPDDIRTVGTNDGYRRFFFWRSIACFCLRL